jgi:hypothetical protein
MAMMAVVFLLMATAAPSAAKDGVTALLRSQGLGHLEPRLRSEGLRSACDLELLNDADLVAIGITHLLPRRRLQRAAQQLCARSSEGRRRGLGIEGIKTFSCIENGPSGMPFPVVFAAEITICEHNATAPGAITHMQFTYTDLAAAYTGARFRAYIDGETAPSIDVQMEPGMFGIPGPDLDHPPKGTAYLPPLWGNARFGHGGESGGISRTGGGGRYFNFRIPFTTHVRLAVYSSAGNGTSQQQQRTTLGMFSIVHGAEGVAATAGGLDLPPTARLRVAEVSNAHVSQYEQVAAVNTSNPGVMAMWIFSVKDLPGTSSMGVSFIEGCQRAWLDSELVQLGDGEDYFDSASSGTQECLPES